MVRSEFHSQAVEAHYSRHDLEAAILSALECDGIDCDLLKPEDLAPIDQFHIGGRKATLELLHQLNLDQNSQVLDVGSGLGGAARCIAQEFACQVTGIDLSGDYCRAASKFTHRFGLDSRVRYLCTDAIDMPFASGSFDLVWTQHAAMNISDKATLYAEIFRVLRPGGTLVIYDILQGRETPIRFPVPWARDPGHSHLVSPSLLKHLLETTGFEILSWQDETAKGLSWLQRGSTHASRPGVPQLGLHLLMGPDFKLMVQNQLRNLEENRTALIAAIVERPS